MTLFPGKPVPPDFFKSANYIAACLLEKVTPLSVCNTHQVISQWSAKTVNSWAETEQT